MARIARIILPGKAHIVSHSAGDRSFNTARSRRALLDLVEDCASRYGIQMLAWCILPDKAYYVLVTPGAGQLSTFMRIVQTRFRSDAAQSQGQEARIDRFSCAALDGPATLEAVRFVESLSVSQRKVKTPSDYKFCSAAARMDEKCYGAKLLAGGHKLTAKVDDWATFHNEQIDTDRAEYLAMRLRTGKPIGSPAFIKRIEGKIGMNLSRPRGRPRKN